MESIVKKAGVVQVVYTIESAPDNEGKAIMSFWLDNGTKIGSVDVNVQDK